MIFKWLALLRTNFELMTAPTQFSVVFNGVIDLFLLSYILFLFLFGITEDISQFYFWIPFLVFVLFVRFKQTKERWKL